MTDTQVYCSVSGSVGTHFEYQLFSNRFGYSFGGDWFGTRFGYSEFDTHFEYLSVG
jgi:hypothetical protein